MSEDMSSDPLIPTPRNAWVCGGCNLTIQLSHHLAQSGRVYGATAPSTSADAV